MSKLSFMMENETVKRKEKFNPVSQKNKPLPWTKAREAEWRQKMRNLKPVKLRRYCGVVIPKSWKKNNQEGYKWERN
jgi:hypothetical protein